MFVQLMSVMHIILRHRYSILCVKLNCQLILYIVFTWSHFKIGDLGKIYIV